MIATECIRDVFSILHDGTISAWTRDKNLLELTVNCQYLAERIDNSVVLTDVDRLELDPWTNPIGFSAIVKTDLQIFLKQNLKFYLLILWTIM